MNAPKIASKAEQTKSTIVDAALRLASQLGLEGLSIGAIAEVTQMSKSGVFAHFGSREELQISVVREYFSRFERDVFTPTLALPRGLPRLRGMFANWMTQVAHEIQSGCIFISGAVEFDDRSGPVRDALEQSMKTWLSAVRRSVAMAVEQGHFSTDAEPKQVVFEIHGLILALHYEARFFKSPRSMDRAKTGFENLLKRYCLDTTPLSAGADISPTAVGANISPVLPLRSRGDVATRQGGSSHYLQGN